MFLFMCFKGKEETSLMLLASLLAAVSVDGNVKYGAKN